MAINENFNLRPHDEAERLASDAFNAFVRAWQCNLPASAVIEHVGATAVPGCLTKGDLDICIRIASIDFEAADQLLAQKFERNFGSVRDGTFSAFKNDDQNPPLGVQLVAMGSDLDFFVAFRDRLRENEGLLSSYNDLKQRYEGRDMDDYRNANADFIHRAISGNS